MCHHHESAAHVADYVERRESDREAARDADSEADADAEDALEPDPVAGD